ncbi:MAG: hypothetical protein DRP42_00415 [Tenericutes bacterium]|nr:MAG: hypothetical protein DRP42_00415 [Mycoplasmatota bacterium]
MFMMMDSGARGNISNFVQLAGMRGLMSKTAHEYAALKRQGIISRTTEEIPIKSSFRTGLSPFEYFLSTHGARKGLSDTATKTAESGYLTRRLVDAVQDVVIIEDNCHTTKGFTVETIFDTRTGAVIESLEDRLIGRYGAKDIKEGNEIKFKIADVLIDADLASEIANAGVESVEIRTSLTCASERGICKKCFGIDLATRQEVNIGEAVGIISAQSIGEPGTQLTMRTFHTGGVAGVSDITQGFNRLIELVDANRNPKSAAIIAKKDGVVESIVQVEQPTESLSMIKEFIVSVKSPKEVNTYKVTSSDYLRVKVGQKIEAGKKIIEGSIKLQELLQYAGPIPTQAYLIKEIQRLYRIQGITISDKYIEVIIRQMLSKVQIQEVGDSNFYTSEIISLDRLKITNAELFAKGKNPAFGKQVIIGVKPLPLKSESFLSAASYQRTADALVNAAIGKKIDELYGVKENLIVGKRIPVGTGYHTPSGKYDIFQNIEAAEALEAELLLKEEMYADIDTSSINDEIRVINKDTK